MSGGKGYEGWAILELFGHRRLAGLLSEAELGGGAFIRIDVPADPPVTQFYSPAAVYGITPCSEEVARASGAQMSSPAAHVWTPRLPSPDRKSATQIAAKANVSEEDALAIVDAAFGVRHFYDDAFVPSDADDEDDEPGGPF